MTAIREQELNLVTTLSENDEIRVLNAYDNMRIKLSSFKNVLGMEGKLSVDEVSQVTLASAKSYIDNKVKTDVPAGAVFTDTLTTINGKTGAITKADITALGIPASDTNTTYSEISTAEIDAGTSSALRTFSGRGAKYLLDKANAYADSLEPDLSSITTSLTALQDGKVDNARVLTDVPANAKFTDTIYTHPNSHPASMITESTTKRFVSDSEKSTWNSKSDTDTITTINGKTGIITKADITALGIPAQDTVVDISGKADKTYVDGKVKTDVPVGAKFTDTVYTHPASHPASMITGLPTSLPASGGNADTVNGKTVGTNVPADAVFTDTKTTINGKTGVILKEDIVALGIPAQDTTYSIATTSVNGLMSSTDKQNLDANTTSRHTHGNKSVIDKFTEVDNKPYYNGAEIGGAVPNLTLSELTLGSRFKIVYNDIEDSLDIEVI